jgi:hypothetical protein
VQVRDIVASPRVAGMGTPGTGIVRIAGTHPAPVSNRPEASAAAGGSTPRRGDSRLLSKSRSDAWRKHRFGRGEDEISTAATTPIGEWTAVIPMPLGSRQRRKDPRST